MSNEIKQGDKVRVSKDAPRIYTPDWVDKMFNLVLKVTKVEDGNASVVFAKRTPYRTVLTTIPCKYLVKVDAEAKEPKYRVGDRVRFKNIYELQKVKAASFHWMLEIFASKEATITAVEDNGFYRVDIDPSVGGINDDMIECKIEPTAPTIKVGDRVRHMKVGQTWEVTAINGDLFTLKSDFGHENVCFGAELELVQPKEQTEKKTNVGSIKIPVEVDITDSYWDAYTADLAKEIALKVVNKKMDNHPEEIGEYAVQVAKAVVEGLKRK